MAEATESLTALFNYFASYKDDSDACDETVFHCSSKLSIYLAENKVYTDGRCMLTNNYLVWRNTAHSKSKRVRILFNLKHVKAITVKSPGKLSAFTTPKLIIYLNDLNVPSTQELYIQLAFKNGNDSRNLFAKKLQSIIAHHITKTEHDEEKNNNMDNYDILKNIIYKEDIIDEIHEKYIKLTVTEFTNAIQALYFIQNYNATQNTMKLNAMRTASEIITHFVRYDDATHHFKVNDDDRKRLCETYFNFEPYLEISSANKMQSYTSYHCHRFLDLNLYVFKLFKHIFPIKVSLSVQQEWIETILRCQWYLSDEYQDIVIGLIDILINEIWNVKFIPMNDINFNDKTDLFVLKHLLSKYCHADNIPNRCNFGDLSNIFLLNAAQDEYDVCLIDILNIAAMETRFDAKSIHNVMVKLVIKHKYTKNDYVILQLIKYIRRRSKDLNLDLQQLLKGVIDEDEALQIIELNLMINDKLIYLKYKNKYNGYNTLEYAQSKEVKPLKIIQFLQHKMEEYGADVDNEYKADEMGSVDKEMDDVDLDKKTLRDMDDFKEILQSINNIKKEMKEMKVMNENMNDMQNKIYAQIVDEKKTDIDEDDLDVDEELSKYSEQSVVDKDWQNWTYLEIVQYFVSLDDGRFSNYKNVLFKNMKYREMKGIDLSVMEKTDLTHFFGINNFGDICALWNHVKTLTQS